MFTCIIVSLKMERAPAFTTFTDKRSASHGVSLRDFLICPFIPRAGDIAEAPSVRLEMHGLRLARAG